MTALRSFLLYSTLAVSLTSTNRAAVTLAPPFRDGAVLQQGKTLPIWGKANAGEKITVTFKDQTKETSADDNGRWEVKLAPLSASSEPAELTVVGSDTIKVGNILVGEVWICSGQSNMAWVVKHSKDPETEIAAANYPLIRHFKAPLSASATPLDTSGGTWETCSPETVGDFSAVGYYFGRELFKKLDVPIGLLNISYGGSPIESWINTVTLQENPAFPAIMERQKEDVTRYPARLKLYEERLAAWEAKKAAANGQKISGRAPVPPSGPGVVDRFTLSSLYNSMLHPFIPYAVRGVIWFQGEANFLRSAEYQTLFPAMITAWRKEFGQGDLPFYYVQLANQARKTDATGVQFAFQREAQGTALKLPNTGVAITADIGEADNSHFKNKQEVGRRLALIALARDYDQQVDFQGPIVKDIAKKGDSFQITFEQAGGLQLKGDEGFEIAGADKIFHPALAKIDGSSLIVRSERVPEPAAIRYAWHNNPNITLYNEAGLPASPFRSDDWPVPSSKDATPDPAE